MKTQLVVSALLLATAMDVSAGWWRQEEEKIRYADFTYTFTNPADNVVGKTFDQFVVLNLQGHYYTTYCNNGTVLNGSVIPIYMTSDYVSGPMMTIGGKNYIAANDYLQVSVNFAFNGKDVPVPTQNTYYAQTGEGCGRTAHVHNPTYSLTVRIAKPFVGFSYIDVPVADFYTGDAIGSGKANGAYQRLHLRGRVVVPQSCNINSDTESVIDFGNIPSYAFKAAGIGNKINGLPKASMSLSIRCNSSIPTNAPLTLRVQADNVGGPANDIIMSSNPDIGFKMSDANDNLLIPNNINSKVNFINTNPANIVLKAWPVSATGNQPAPGPFQARGYLRIDFD